MASLVSIYRRFPDREAAVAHLESVRWPDGPICPYCMSPKASRNNDGSRTLTAARWQCQACKRSYSVTVGTIFHGSHIDLQRWFLLIALMLNAKKGLSSMQAARDLEMRQPTVWSMMQRVRAAMADDGALLAGLVEMDEAYIGGKPRKRNRRDDDGPPAPRGRATNKQPIIGAVERKGRVKVKPVSSERMATGDMLALTRSWVAPGAVMHTDEYAGYNTLSHAYVSRRINHAQSYVEDDLFSGQYGRVHTNTIEGFWAIVKRAILGQYHHVSRKHLGGYLQEIAWRYNHRSSRDAFADLLGAACNPQCV